MEAVLFFSSMAFSSLGTVAGFGGGIFLVPLMILGFDAPATAAIGVTALSLFPSSLLTSLLKMRKQAIDFKLLVVLEIPTMFGAYLGARLTGLLPTRPLEICFGFFLFFIAWKMFRPGNGRSKLSRSIQAVNDLPPVLIDKEYKVSLSAAGLFGAMAGLVAGFFGIGGGIVKTPLMIQVFKVPVKIATATAMGTIVFTSLVSGLTHYQLGHVAPEYLWACSSGFLAGSVAGYFIDLKIEAHTLRKIIAVSVFLAGIAVFVHALLLP